MADFITVAEMVDLCPNCAQMMLDLGIDQISTADFKEALGVTGAKEIELHYVEELDNYADDKEIEKQDAYLEKQARKYPGSAAVTLFPEEYDVIHHNYGVVYSPDNADLEEVAKKVAEQEEGGTNASVATAEEEECMAEEEDAYPSKSVPDSVKKTYPPFDKAEGEKEHVKGLPAKGQGYYTDCMGKYNDKEYCAKVAWSIWCKNNPDSKHCKQGKYLTGKGAPKKK